MDKNTIGFHPDKPFLTAAILESSTVNKNLDEMSRQVKYINIYVHLSEILTDFATFHKKGELLLESDVIIDSNKSVVGKLYSFQDCIVLESR